jgi:V/A-type H+/Na+-transporting ATPase subunit A
MESLSNRERLVLLVAKSIREDFLFQDAFSPEDAYTPPKKQFGMLKTIMTVYHAGLEVIEGLDFDFRKLQNLPELQEVVHVKDIPRGEEEKYEGLQKRVRDAILALR